MHHHACEPHVLSVPSADEAQLAVESAQRLFRRTLPGWASDMLRAQHAGLMRIGWQAERSHAGWRQAA